MSEALEIRPDWNVLYETAAPQEGLFTTRQAAEAGYSPQLLGGADDQRSALDTSRDR